MIEKNFITRSEWNKHIHGNWRVSHAIWPHLRNYVPGWGYSQAEIDAFFEGEDGGKKQVHWDRITNKPATFAPSAHTLASHSTRAHSELSDAPADAHHAQIHAAEHEVGGGDLLAFADITGFGDYLDQAVKQASNVQFNSVQAIIFMAYGTVGTPDPLYRLKPFGTADESFVRWLDNTGSDEWSIGTQSHQAGFVIRRESGTPANLVVVQRATGIVNIGVNLDTPKLTINGGFYIDTLAANNRIDDSDKWGGNAFDDYMNQAVKTTSNVEFGSVQAPIFMAYGVVAYPDALYRLKPFGTSDESFVKYLDNTGSEEWSIGTLSHQASWVIRRESGTPGNMLLVDRATGKVTAAIELVTPKLTIGSYYLNSLIANNKVPDADTLDTIHASGFLSSAYLSGRSIADCNNADVAGVTVYYAGGSNRPPGTDHCLLTLNYSADWSVQIAGDWRTSNLYVRKQESSSWGTWYKIWSEGNQGTGTGLDADKVDGEHASAIVTKARVDGVAADHGSLGGRGDDDHSIYYNAARHTKAVHTGLGLMPYTGGTFTGVVLMTAKLEAADHGTFSIDEVVNVCYGTSTPPLPNTTTHGTIFLKYTA